MGTILSWKAVRTGIAVLAIIALAVGAWRWLGYTSRWEQRAQAAVAAGQAAEARADSIEAVLAAALARTRARFVRIDTLTQYVAVVDSIHLPDVAHAPNLAARDAVIAVQAEQIIDLHAIIQAQADEITALRESHSGLLATLAARPKARPLLGPNIGIGGSIGVNQTGRIEARISLNLNVLGLRL